MIQQIGKEYHAIIIKGTNAILRAIFSVARQRARENTPAIAVVTFSNLNDTRLWQFHPKPMNSQVQLSGNNDC